MNMFCYQCEQTAQQTGCTAHGVCGKDPETAALQDLLIYALKDICRYAHRARDLGCSDPSVDRFVPAALFATITNTNFAPSRLRDLVREGVQIKNKALTMYEQAAGKQGLPVERLDCAVPWWESIDSQDQMVRCGEAVTIQKRLDTLGEDITDLQELLTYGLKGAGAYAWHAAVLDKEDDEVYAFFHDALDFLSRDEASVEELLAKLMECGQANLQVMELLDRAHTETYGHPEPTTLRVTPVKGKCIAVSGHDLKDLEEILKQTAGIGINVYTHSEMLMCNSYPGLKKYPHLVGNYGGAWQDQRQDFEQFPGAILMTTNCIQQPKHSYADRLFTSGPTAWPGIPHIDNYDFSPVIKAALAAPGFDRDAPEKFIMTGFAHNAVMQVAGPVVDAVKAGKIRHFFLVGGCDGAKPGRNYYTRLAEQIPDDCVILTLACGKYRFNKMEFGQIDGIPRLLDCGQCNDAYSAIQIALALAGAFECDVNQLPLSLILSWFEQKAVAILLTLLSLGVQDIRLGPTLPAFVSPNMLAILQSKFGLKQITTPEQDLQAILG